MKKLSAIRMILSEARVNRAGIGSGDVWACRLLAQVQVISSSQWVRSLAKGAKGLLRRGFATPITYAHPCRIDRESYLIHEQGLRERDTVAFEQLERFAEANGYRLREDRRRQDSRDSCERRQPWAEVLVLTLGLTAGSALGGERTTPPSLMRIGTCCERNAVRTVVRPLPGIALQLFSDRALSVPRDRHGGVLDDLMSLPSDNAPSPPNPVKASELRRILLSHYDERSKGPPYLAYDLEKMADYYIQFPEVVSLLESLKDEPWKLSYKRRTWRTEARGTSVSVRSLAVHFDSRVGAILGLNPQAGDGPRRRVSPADALLHELLHVRSILRNPAQFLDHGGLFGTLYAEEYEMTILAEENVLYTQMSRRDGLERPQRASHSGRLVQASCSVCTR